MSFENTSIECGVEKCATYVKILVTIPFKLTRIEVRSWIELIKAIY